jgi:hypothetical protein
MKAPLRLAAFAASAVSLAGCMATYTQQPGGGFGPAQVVLQTPGGFYPLYSPPETPAVEPNLAAPPGGFGVQPVGGRLVDGTYSGTAQILQNDNGACPFQFDMTNMHLEAGQVRFARFRGKVGPDGGVRMPDGATNWITGQFAGTHFSGFYSNRFCAYSLSLDRVGP